MPLEAWWSDPGARHGVRGRSCRTAQYLVTIGDANAVNRRAAGQRLHAGAAGRAPAGDPWSRDPASGMRPGGIDTAVRRKRHGRGCGPPSPRSPSRPASASSRCCPAHPAALSTTRLRQTRATPRPEGVNQRFGRRNDGSGVGGILLAADHYAVGIEQVVRRLGGSVPPLTTSSTAPALRTDSSDAQKIRHTPIGCGCILMPHEQTTIIARDGACPAHICTPAEWRRRGT